MKQKYIHFDWAIKRLLRNKADFEILEGFLSVLLKKDIKIVNILEGESNKATPDDKFNRVDLLAMDSDGEKIIIEIQNNHELDYFNRILYGTSKVVTESINMGERYKKINKVYSISIIYFKLGVGDDYVYHGTTEFHGIHTDNILHLTEDQKELFKGETVGDIYPEYYILNVNNFDKVAKTPLDEWIYFLKTGEISSEVTAQGLSKAKAQWRYCLLTKEEQTEYDNHIDALDYQRGSLWTSHYEGKKEGKEEGLKEGEQKGLKKGEKIGLKKGKEIGLKKGIDIGKEEGLKEGLEKGEEIGKRNAMIETAHRMKAEGIDIDVILKVTGLTMDDID